MREPFKQIEMNPKHAALGVAIAVGSMLLFSCARTNQSDPPGPGYDVSSPQCGHEDDLPKAHSFNLIGVNDLKPGSFNQCFDKQRGWALRSPAGAHQPKVSLYVNSANAGKPAAAHWPKTGHNKYGECHGEDSQACAYESGARFALADIAFLKKHLSKKDRPMIWIDVEKDNSWECNEGIMRLCDESASIHVATGAHGRNAATLEGMAKTFWDAKYAVGIYTNYNDWDLIIDGQDKTTSLHGLPVWINGLPPHSKAEKTTEATAITNCSTQVGALGHVILSQYTTTETTKHGKIERDVDIICADVAAGPTPKQ